MAHRIVGDLIVGEKVSITDRSARPSVWTVVYVDSQSANAESKIATQVNCFTVIQISLGKPTIERNYVIRERSADADGLIPVVRATLIASFA